MSTDYVASMFGLLPPNVRSMVLVGSAGHGALVARYRQSYPASFVHLLAHGAQLTAPERPDVAHAVDPCAAPPALFARLDQADCWVFDGTLEALADPAAVLAAVRRVIPPDACIVLRVANGQYWDRQPPAGTTAHQYGIQELVDLLGRCGWRPAGGAGVLDATPPDAVTAALRQVATAVGRDPEQAMADALPVSYLVKAIPA